jgi:hypothetical protein
MRRDPSGSSKAEQSGFWNRRCPLKQEIWREFGSKLNLTLAICDATGQSSYLPWSGYSESKNSVYHLRPSRQSSVFSSFTFPRLPASHKLRNPGPFFQKDVYIRSPTICLSHAGYCIGNNFLSSLFYVGYTEYVEINVTS